MFRKTLCSTLCLATLSTAALPVASATAGPRGERVVYEETYTYRYESRDGRDFDRRVSDRRDWDRRDWDRRDWDRRNRREAREAARRQEERRRRAAERRRDRDDDDRTGQIIAGALVGVATAVIVNGMNRSQRQPVVRHEPQPNYGSARYAAWTPEWENWCANRYRSFNPDTGTWRGYDGKTYFCQPN